MNLKLKRTPGLYLLGFMASGKSTIGRQLADRLGWSFFDTDHEIEAAEKIAIAQIFDTRGEAEFRRIESEILRQHVRLSSAAGPPWSRSAAARSWRPGTASCWLLTASPSGWTVRSRPSQRRVAKSSHRPLARDPETFAALYAARRETYCLADIRVPIESDDPQPRWKPSFRIHF